MEEKLNKVSVLIDNCKNIPIEIKGIVKVICRGYIRESKGLIPISGIMNVCYCFQNSNKKNKKFNILAQQRTPIKGHFFE